MAVVLLSTTAALACSGPARSKTGEPGTAAKQTASAPFTTEYQAVVLTSGQAFFGKLEGFGSANPILRDVYYVQTVPTQAKDASKTHVLVKRGGELHAPDYMILNSSHILLVEPVAESSKVAQLIAEQKGRGH